MSNRTAQTRRLTGHRVALLTDPAGRLDADWLRDRPVRRVVAALEAVQPGCARFVGGCVRNTLMGRAVDDIDIATQLRPDAVVTALGEAGLRAIPTGIEHGTVTAIASGRPFEITSLRRDVATDGRRAVVAFTQSWAEDALRRDFRLNALYAEPDGTLHDPTGGGLEDAATGRVIFIGEADHRLREDYLRILRFFRFNAWYGAAVDPDGLAACTRAREGLRRIAAERIWKEVRKLLAAPAPEAAVVAMAASGVVEIVLPGADCAQLPELVAAEAAAGLAPDPMRRLMAMLPRTPDTVASLAGALRLSNAERDRIEAWADPELSLGLEDGLPAWRGAIYRHGARTARDHALVSAGGDPAGRAPVLAVIERWTPPRFPLGGQDALALGLEGADIGAALRAVEAGWVAEDFAADAQALRARLSSWQRPSH